MNHDFFFNRECGRFVQHCRLSAQNRGDAANHIMTSSGNFWAARLLPSEQNWQPRQSPISWKQQLLQCEWSALIQSSGPPGSVRSHRFPPFQLGDPGADCLASSRGSANVTFFFFFFPPPRVTWPRPRAASPLIQSDDTEASRAAAPHQNQADLAPNSCDMQHGSSGESASQSVIVGDPVLLMKLWKKWKKKKIVHKHGRLCMWGEASLFAQHNSASRPRALWRADQGISNQRPSR